MPENDTLSLAFLQKQPFAAAQLLQDYPPDQTALFVARLTVSDLIPVIRAMASWPAARLISHLPVNLASGLLAQLTITEAETLLRLLDSEPRQALLEQLPKKLAKSFIRKLAYPTTTVGAWMNSTIPGFDVQTSIAHCLEVLKSTNTDLSGILIIANRERKLEGVVELEQLLTADPKDNLASLLQSNVQALPARATLWEAEHNEDWSRFPGLPVVDHEQTLLGVLSHSALTKAMNASRPNRIDNKRLSLITHMISAFFVSLSGLLPVASGFNLTSRNKS